MPSLVSPNGEPMPRIVTDGVAWIGRIELDGRNQLFHAIHVERARAGDELATQHRHRNRNFLNRLFDATRRHDHAFGESSRRQRHVDLRRLASVDGTTSHGRLESVERRLHAILAGSQVGHLIAALCVADGFLRGASGFVNHANRRTGDGTAGRVTNHTADSGRGLSDGCRGNQPGEQHRGQHEHSAKHRISSGRCTDRRPETAARACAQQRVCDVNW